MRYVYGNQVYIEKYIQKKLAQLKNVKQSKSNGERGQEREPNKKQIRGDRTKTKTEDLNLYVFIITLR